MLVGIRDDGRGDLTVHDDSLRPIAERVRALDGTLVGLVPFSAREREVLRLVVSGARNRDIGRQLSISENTVKFHVSNLLRKAGARSRAESSVLAKG